MLYVKNVYGPTEATIFCMTYKIGNAEEIIEYNGIVNHRQSHARHGSQGR